jgi:hypothetical protein
LGRGGSTEADMCTEIVQGRANANRTRIICSHFPCAYLDRVYFGAIEPPTLGWTKHAALKSMHDNDDTMLGNERRWKPIATIFPYPYKILGQKRIVAPQLLYSCPGPGVSHLRQPRPRYLNMRHVAEHVFASKPLASSLHIEPRRAMTP